MKKYLSIGEVTKIKEVSHTSLRYYDEIGILVPAYTNPDTGYRYYARSQMIILDIILLAIELGMPLKELEKYKDGDSIDLEKLHLEAKKNIKNSIRKLQRSLYFLESTTKYFDEYETKFNKDKEYTREIDARCFLALPSSIDFNADNPEGFAISDYWKQLTKLYTLSRDYELYFSTDQGIYLYQENNELKSMVYVEIKNIKKKNIENAKVIQIPKGKFLCSFFQDACLKSVSEQYLQHKDFSCENFLIISDVLEKKVGNLVMPFETQLFMKN